MRINRRDWAEGIGLIDIESEGMRVSVSDYGGIIQSLTLDTPDGGTLDAVLGFDDLESYRRSDAFLGAMIGPVADRIAGGRCLLDGREIRLPRNAGPDCTHSADLGFHRVAWEWEALEDGICLSRTFEETPNGFPGALSVRLNYRIIGPGVLRLEYAARCTRQTAASFTNHSYFNLSGGVRDCLGHRLTVRADRYAETVRSRDPICSGRTLPVAGTPLDLRGGPTVGSAVARTDFREIAVAGGVDHYFPVNGEGMREQAVLRNPENGLTLTCRSNAPGLLVYTANGLSEPRGKGGRSYGRNWGVCLETANFPNGVNLPGWRGQVLLEPGSEYRAATEFRFSWN